MESPRGSSVIIMEIDGSSIQLKRCARGTAFPPKIMEKLYHHHGDRPLVDSIKKVCQGHGLPTQDYGEPKRELYHHHGDRPLVDLIKEVCQEHGLPTQDHGEPQRDLCHHRGDRC